MEKNKKLIIVGDGEFAEIAYEYFTHDSQYDVCGFAVEKEYLNKNKLFNLPVVPFEEIEKHFPVTEYHIFVAITFTKLNRVRTRLYNIAKAKGYKIASYVSSKAFVWHNATIGENCFIFENNVIQYHAKLGNNVILWSGNHVGHRAVIEDNCFISSHVVISGYCRIGESCFVGVNTTLIDNVNVGKDCFVGAATFINKNLETGCLYTGAPAAKAKISSFSYFKISE